MDIELGQVWQDYDLAEVSTKLDNLFPEYSFDLELLLEKLLSGDIMGAVGGVFDAVLGGSLHHFAGMKEVLVWIMLVGIAASVITHFVNLFENRQVADISFYFVYLLFVTLLLKCFQEAAVITAGAIDNLVAFIKLFVPAYVISVGVATGTSTATAYYGILLAVIYLIQNLLLTIVVPCIYGYVLLSVINGIWPEEKLATLVSLLEKGIRLLLKFSMGAVMGVSVLQSMITPVIDSAKASGLQKVVSFIPGVGTTADGMMDMMLGSALIIKNSIGVIMLILLIAVCAIPVFKICVVAVMLKIAAAFLGIISDKRMVTCTDKVGSGSVLLLKTTGTAFALFFLIISVTAITTNRGF